MIDFFFLRKSQTSCLADCNMSFGGLKWLTVVFTVILVWSGECYGVSESCGELAHRVVRALDGALGFFDREYDKVNLDAVVGVRMAQSQLQAALAELDAAKPPELKSLQDELQKLSDQAETICDRAIPVVKRQYPKDYKDLGLLISGDFWNAGSTAEKRQTDRSLGSAPRQDEGWEPLSEPLTDRCISQLLGTKTEPCSITSFCWLAMTPRGYRSYSLSHQVLYLTVGSMMGCESHMIKRLHTPDETDRTGGSMLDSLTDGFCSDVLREAEATAGEGYPTGSQDLFMEQVLLCGLKGYEDFFRLPWLQAVLSWQDASGCFKNDVYRPHASDVDLDDPKNADVSGHVRIRRRENEVSGTGCLMHKTAVGTGFLSIYLRMLIDTMATGETVTNCL
ncbi:UPF0764 protein C16orf89 homolog [Patiria miniata]|uniref:Uncharacterized protein n=1 Tax=Patiria miniata TaxID=46514 RepID=A0A914AR50_PATMI|nr:UPF0764 protein C16orf89 homolog [Patiria miniata]